MARWQDIVDSEPAFADAMKARFDAHRHKVLATLRKNGAPRISGIETLFKDGDIWLGMMPDSMKCIDLRRDPRLELHSTSDDPPEDDPGGWPGDAKVSGLGMEVHDDDVKRRILADGETAGYAPEAIPLFRVEINSGVVLRMGEPADHLLVELWRPGAPLQRTKRV